MSPSNEYAIRKKLPAFLKDQEIFTSRAGQAVLDDLDRHPDKPLLDVVLPIWMTSREKMAVLHWLLDEGLNPLDHSHATLGNYVHEEHSMLPLSFVLRAREAHKGQPLRAPDGGNWLHVLCELRPEWLGRSLVDYVDNLPNNENRYLASWFNEPMLSDGKTPLHVWWEGIAKELEQSRKLPNSPFAEFDVSEALIRGGAEVNALDHEDVSCARMMFQAAELGLAMPMQASGVQQAKIVWDAEELERNTVLATKSHTSYRL